MTEQAPSVHKSADTRVSEPSRRGETASVAHPPVQALAATGKLLNARPPVQRQRALGAQLARAPRHNPGGLPAQLRAGVEALCGVAMDDVRVHRNSGKPAQLHAHAFAQGSHIHLAPGQEHHLPHEAWHVVQQKQGRVRATRQLKAGVPVNDDAGLEAEADRMGALALRTPAAPVQRLHDGGAEGELVQLVLKPEPYDTQYVGPLIDLYRRPILRLIHDLNQRVYAAYEQSLQWQTLQHTPGAHIQQWYNTAANYALNPDQEPRIISARFGYSIETLACAGLNNSTLYGLTLRTQITHGHTRPDIVVVAAGEEIAWIDITSTASTGHIRGKEGAGWATRPFVYELVYPQLQLRALLNATNDPYYAEVGGLIAAERQIELDVKDKNARRLRDELIKLRDDNGWYTGSRKPGAAEKRKITRDYIHREAASEGVEEESHSMRNTRGALEALGINPGPYGFNRGDVGSSNQRVNQVIDAVSEEEIGVDKSRLHARTTHRIIGELQGSNVPDALLQSLWEDFGTDPGAREVSLAAMALKGVDVDLPELASEHDRLQAMDQRDHRVPALDARIQQQRAGPDSIFVQTILAWRRQAHALIQQSQALEQVLDATEELHQFLTARNIGYFQRPAVVHNLFNGLARSPPDAQIAQAAHQWVHQQLLIEALRRLRVTQRRLDHVYDFIRSHMDGREPRVRNLETEVRDQIATPPVVALGPVNAWIAQANTLDQRTVDLNQVLQATAALRRFENEHGLHFFNRPLFISTWFFQLAASPPDTAVAQQVTQWIRQQAQAQQHQQQGAQTGPQAAPPWGRQ